MKYLILTIVFFFVTINGKSQSFTGKVVYKASIDDKAYKDAQKKLLQKQPKFNEIIRKNLKATKDIRYELIIKNNESEFNYIESLNSDNAEGVNYTKVLAGNGGVYTSLEPTVILRKNRYFPQYVIKENPIDWNLENIQKNILGFKCFKATGEVGIETSSGIEKNKIIAWYTNDIPVSFGPKSFSGLPGLIVQLSDTRGLLFEYESLKEMKVANNKIKKPTGEIISNNEFQSKIKALKDQYHKGD